MASLKKKEKEKEFEKKRKKIKNKKEKENGALWEKEIKGWKEIKDWARMKVVQSWNALCDPYSFLLQWPHLYCLLLLT